MMSASLPFLDDEQVHRLFDVAVELGSDERSAYLRRACAGDPALRSKIDSLLLAYARADDVLDPYERLVREPLEVYPTPPDTAVSPDRLVGKQVAQYRILAKIGGGGMGVAYKALDAKLGRLVALKFLPPELTRDAEATERFFHEARAASLLDHPYIAVVYEIGETVEERLFIAMAYYDGETLKHKIARGALPVGEAVDYAIQIGEGLTLAHETGIVHRDVKPANLMVAQRGEVKIVDFGLAKMTDVSLTRTGATMGTVSYMSPEQVRGEGIDQRTDLWSLGVVLYEMLTGVRPFKGVHEQAVIYAILNEEPMPVEMIGPEVPTALAGVASKLLNKDPDERYPSAEKMLADLHEVRGGREVTLPASCLLQIGCAVCIAHFSQLELLSYWCCSLFSGGACSAARGRPSSLLRYCR